MTESELAYTGLHTTPSQTVQVPRIAEAPVAFECVLHELMATGSRYGFIGRVQWLAVREGLVDTAKWRVKRQDDFPVGRFGASFYVIRRERFAIQAHEGKAALQGAVPARPSMKCEQLALVVRGFDVISFGNHCQVSASSYTY